MTEEFKGLGRSVGAGLFEKHLETFPAPARVREVTMTSDEVTAICPVTGQPDWYTVAITFLPNQVCLESKSLKLYLQSFRNEGLFCERFADVILLHLLEVLKPKSMEVVVSQKPRGGVAIRAVATYLAEPPPAT